MKEQFRRFCSTLHIDCDHCPIRKECEEFSDKCSPLMEFCEEYSCEHLLFRWVMNGEKPQVLK